jgi:hypothetical protein
MAKLVPSQVRSRAAINKRWPKRDKGSDGWIADKFHRPPSEHIPDSRGWVRATDTDVDGIHRPTVVADFILHPATWYVISHGRIYRRADEFRPRTYTGKNKHTGHIHRSTLKTSAADASTTDYPLIEQKIKSIPARHGDRGYTSRVLQALLNANGASLVVDGDYGDATDQAVKAFQRSRKLTADGIVGPKTFAALTGGKA